MLKILIAPAAYKGTLSPGAVARAIARGAQDSGRKLELMLAPLADGGDGTVESLKIALGGQVQKLTVTGPLGEDTLAHWLKVGRLAVVELASACGIALLGGRPLRPLAAHTLGLGQVLAGCLASGEREIVVAVGGSASTDGGAGALRGLGARFFDGDHVDLPLGGGSLINLESGDLTALEGVIAGAVVRVATDVTNPLLGPDGAANVFGPQKGATAEDCLLLDRALERLADVLEASTGRRLRDIPGAGAAGGAAFGLSCALGAEIISGSQWIAEQLSLPEKIANCDLVVTGEGRLDNQTLLGKGVGQLAQLCAAADRPLWVIAGRSEPNIDWAMVGIERVITVCQGDKPASEAELRAKACEAFKSL